MIQSVEASFEVAHLRCTIREAEWLVDVNILSDRGIEEYIVDVNYQVDIVRDPWRPQWQDRAGGWPCE
jgi:hypothetical protein